MSKAFRLGDYLKPEEPAVPKLNTSQPERIEYLPLDQIDPDPDNFYSLEGIEDLAENIELVGLLDPIRVRHDGARYVVVSGHRRRAACMMIRDGGNPMFDKGVPCIVERGSADDDWRRLRLIFANSHTRVLSPAEISRQADEVLKLLTKLKASGVELPGRMREHVAEALNVSSSKLGRVQAIRRNLVPELLAMYDAGRINEAVAYRISQEDAEMQGKILADQGDVLHHLTADGIDAYVAHRRFMDSHKHDDGAVGAAISRPREAEDDGDGRLVAATTGKTKAPEKRQPWKKDDEEIQRNRELWARVAERRKQCGLSITEAYQTEPDEEKFWRDYETGKSRPEFPPHVELFMSDEELCDFADRLFCSIDFLFGRTEIPETAETFLNNLPQLAKVSIFRGAWCTGHPAEPGRYLCLVDLDPERVLDNGRLHEQKCDWDGSEWRVYGRSFAEIGRVLRWSVLPPQVETLSALEKLEDRDE